MMAGTTSTSPATPAQASCCETTGTARSATSRPNADSPTAPMAWPRQAWDWRSGTIHPMASSTLSRPTSQMTSRACTATTATGISQTSRRWPDCKPASGTWSGERGWSTLTTTAGPTSSMLLAASIRRLKRSTPTTRTAARGSYFGTSGTGYSPTSPSSAGRGSRRRIRAAAAPSAISTTMATWTSW